MLKGSSPTKCRGNCYTDTAHRNFKNKNSSHWEKTFSLNLIKSLSKYKNNTEARNIYCLFYLFSSAMNFGCRYI